jgi:uncharacterized protein YneF (UPF0154 family)
MILIILTIILELVAFFIVGRICYKVNKELKEIAGELCLMKRTK